MLQSLKQITVSVLIFCMIMMVFSTIWPTFLYAQHPSQQNGNETINIKAQNGLLNTHLQSMAGEAERDRLLGSYVMFGLGGFR